MAGRNGGPWHQINGVPHTEFHPIHEPPFGRALGVPPHPAVLEQMMKSQFGRDPRLFPPHHALIEERLAAQHQEIQGLLLDNHQLAATHVPLNQELEITQHELKRMVHIVESMKADKDVELRGVYEKSLKMEADLRVAVAMKAEFRQVCEDIQKINASRQELTSQVQALSQNLARANADLQQVPALKAEIESIKHELQRARASLEYEKKGHAKNYEHRQAMEKNLISMTREVEMLRAEIANAEKRVRAAAAVGSTAPGFGGNYSNPNAGYGANPYPAGFGMNPVQGGAENAAHYGPRPAAWGAYDM